MVTIKTCRAHTHLLVSKHGHDIGLVFDEDIAEGDGAEKQTEQRVSGKYRDGKTAERVCANDGRAERRGWWHENRQMVWQDVCVCVSTGHTLDCINHRRRFSASSLTCLCCSVEPSPSYPLVPVSL